MPQIKFRMFYTELVEHYLRVAVRHKNVGGNTPYDWFRFAKNWIGYQSEEDKEFISFVFNSQFFSATEGLYCFESKDDMYAKRIRLAKLERKFAIDGGLIVEDREETVQSNKD